MSAKHERVPFRLLITPCCNYAWCLVNHRLPNYCIECGTFIHAIIKTDPSCIMINDQNAELRYHDQD